MKNIENFNKEEIMSRIIETIIKSIPLVANISEFENITLDSLQIVNLLIDLENEFNIEFSEQSLKLENFSSVSKIYEMVISELNK